MMELISIQKYTPFLIQITIDILVLIRDSRRKTLLIINTNCSHLCMILTTIHQFFKGVLQEIDFNNY